MLIRIAIRLLLTVTCVTAGVFVLVDHSARATDGAQSFMPTAMSTPVETSIRQISLTTIDLIYDPWNQTIYASVPSQAESYGNSIVPINPETGALGAPIFVGNGPNILALSDNGEYLYVGLDAREP